VNIKDTQIDHTVTHMISLSQIVEFSKLEDHHCTSVY
jgi:hypothetical protein